MPTSCSSVAETGLVASLPLSLSARPKRKPWSPSSRASTRPLVRDQGSVRECVPGSDRASCAWRIRGPLGSPAASDAVVLARNSSPAAFALLPMSDSGGVRPQRRCRHCGRVETASGHVVDDRDVAAVEARGAAQPEDPSRAIAQSQMDTQATSGRLLPLRVVRHWHARPANFGASRASDQVSAGRWRSPAQLCRGLAMPT